MATTTPEISTLSLHDALPISDRAAAVVPEKAVFLAGPPRLVAASLVLAGSDKPGRPGEDRKSTRLNSSHANISYAVFCLKKKKKKTKKIQIKNRQSRTHETTR